MGRLSRAFKRKISNDVAELRAEAEVASKAPPIDGAAAAAKPQSLANVPACVHRYLAHAAVGSPEFKLVTARQVGEFRLAADGPWLRMEADQVASPLVPAIVWTAKCRISRLAATRGLDRLLGCKGAVDWRLWGWMRVVHMHGATLDATMLTRWLAETPGFPRAMLPSHFLRWEAVEGADSEARATLTYGGTAVSGIFTFNKAGLVVSFRSHCYQMPDSKTSAPGATWVVRYSGHATRELAAAGSGSEGAAGRMFTPCEAKGAWVWPDGREVPYVRFRLQSLTAE